MRFIINIQWKLNREKFNSFSFGLTCCEVHNKRWMKNGERKKCGAYIYKGEKVLVTLLCPSLRKNRNRIDNLWLAKLKCNHSYSLFLFIFLLLSGSICSISHEASENILIDRYSCLNPFYWKFFFHSVLFLRRCYAENPIWKVHPE